MGSKQVGYVLIALIVIGIAGLVVRLIAAGSSELTLEGILPVSPDVIDRVTITAPAGDEARLDKINDVWQVDREEAFLPKLNQLWTAAADIDGAQRGLCDTVSVWQHLRFQNGWMAKSGCCQHSTRCYRIHRV